MEPTYINHTESYALSAFCTGLESFLNEVDDTTRNIIILCIGTDRCTGDSLGPLVGHNLTKYNLKNASILGTLNNPVHAGNLQETIENIHKTHISPFIVAIDACLGSYDHIGHICLKDGPLYPGAAMKKNLPPVGDVNITGIVNMYGFLDNLVLQSTRLSLVMSMSDIISRGIHYVLWKKNRIQKAI